VVEDCGQNHAHESPNTTDKSNVSPGVARGNELAVENGWSEGNDGKDERRDVHSTFPGWSQLRRYGKRCELIDSSTSTGNSHACDECVHRMRGGCDNVADDEERSAGECDVSTTEQVAERADERTYCSQCEQVANDIPCPAIKAAKLAVNYMLLEGAGKWQ
jgi:hypothetical protein